MSKESEFLWGAKEDALLLESVENSSIAELLNKHLSMAHIHGTFTEALGKFVPVDAVWDRFSEYFNIDLEEESENKTNREYDILEEEELAELIAQKKQKYKENEKIQQPVVVKAIKDYSRNKKRDSIKVEKIVARQSSTESQIKNEKEVTNEKKDGKKKKSQDSLGVTSKNDDTPKTNNKKSVKRPTRASRIGLEDEDEEETTTRSRTSTPTKRGRRI